MWIVYGTAATSSSKKADAVLLFGRSTNCANAKNLDVLSNCSEENEETELAFGSAKLGNVDMKVADGIALQFLLAWFVSFHLQQQSYAAALQAAMQRRSHQVWDGQLQSIEAVIKRQNGITADGDDDRSLLATENGLSVRLSARLCDRRPLRRFRTALRLIP